MKTLLIIVGGLILVFGGGVALAQQITPALSIVGIAAVAIVALIVGNLTINNPIVGNNNTVTSTKYITIKMEHSDEGIKEIIE